MPHSQDYKIRNVIKAVFAERWLILPSKMEEIVALLEARAAGIIPSESEVSLSFGNPAKTNEDKGPTIIGGIQVIDVFGTLAPRMNLMMRYSGGTSTQKLAKEIREAGQNEMVKTVILRVDSPGGAYSLTPEAAAAIRELRGKKRVVTSASDMMASGAYWIGTAAEQVYASESTAVGSIGVYTVLSNVKEAAEKSGVKHHVFRGGNLKAAGLPYEDLNDDRRASIQKSIDDIYADFVGAVAKHRNVSGDKVEESFGQGTTFLAAEAKQRGMIDDVATFEEVFERERKRLDSPGVRALTVKGDDMNTRVKAALYARGLIESMEVADDVAKTALDAFCKASGIETKDLTDDQVAEKVSAHRPASVQSLESVTTELVPQVTEGSKSESPDATLAERERITELRARGSLLSVSNEDIDIAISEGTSVESALISWTDKKAEESKPVGRIEIGDSQLEKVNAAAGAIIAQRCGLTLTEDEKQSINAHGGELKRRKLIDIVRVSQESRGVRATYDDHEDAKTFLSQPGRILTADYSTNRRGDHPDLLSSLTSKALTEAATVARVTYPRWCEKLPDLPDFKPRSFIDVGIFDHLDAITEDKAPKQMKMESEMRNWIAADRYGGQAGLTIEMVVDDDLGGFTRMLRSVVIATGQTVNKVILELFTSNPTVLDGNAFFSAAHNNLIASGAAPSAAQFREHRKKHRLQKSYGSKNPMGLTFDRILVPVEHEDAAIRATTRVLDENKTPTADADINTFRGTVDPIVEAYLDNYDVNAWYSIVDPMMSAAVVYAFQSGFGDTGRQEEYFNPETGTRYVKVETRFGCAMGNYRAMVMNPGQ